MPRRVMAAACQLAALAVLAFSLVTFVVLLAGAGLELVGVPLAPAVGGWVVWAVAPVLTVVGFLRWRPGRRRRSASSS